ncbi:LacI family transcriptional regulator [Loktanella sp. M215]|uniref:LacI family transcriptional regulator n=1 Tax=Loktanella sp. M215 TaxID=2675431 RepID=UPI001F27C750|nr:LacI family transcriptional regulator [Loktanella sp. M215]MCF7698448.1 LacI family DNA-binding transcriptional regulator [Loktanella sp. M215]
MSERITVDNVDGSAPRKPTLKTIAGLTGLAVPTVSRALSGAEDISLQTRARVRAVADQIGYVPNRAGVRLRTGRTNVISLVMSTEHDVMNHTAKLISSVAGGLRNTPFHLNITPYFKDEDPMKPIRYLVETGSADAVIFNQIMPADPRIRYLMDRGFPFATHGRSNWSDRHAWFDFDNRAFGALGVRSLAARGRRRLVLIAPPRDQSYAIAMIGGAMATAQSLNVDLVVLDDVNSDSPLDLIEASLTALLSGAGPTDGVIAGSTNAALAVIAAAEAGGRVLGQDLDIFSKEAITFLRRIHPRILAVSEDVAAAGDFLARAAMAGVRQPTAAPMQHLDSPPDTLL